MAKYCRNCGAPAADEAKFCLSCGQQFAALPPPPPQPQPSWSEPLEPYPEWRPPSRPAAPLRPAPKPADTRPGCVAVYVAAMTFLAISAFSVLMASMAVFADIPGISFMNMPGGLETVLICLVITAVSVTVAIGVYELRSWGRVLAMVVQGLGILLNLYLLVRAIQVSSEYGRWSGESLTGTIVAIVLALVVQVYIIWWFGSRGELFRE